MKSIHVIRKSFDSGFRGDYKGYHINRRIIQQPSPVSAIVLKIYQYQMDFILLNNTRVGYEIFERLEYLNTLIEQCIQEDYIVKQIKEIPNLSVLNLKKEQIIHIMKRIIDDIIIVLCIYYDLQNIELNNKITISSIGHLYSTKGKLQPIIENIKNELNFNKYKNLFETINDLHNAYKHSLLINESHGELSPNCTSISAYYAKDGKINEVYYLNHNLIHIVIGFSDFLVEFCGIEITDNEQNLLIEETDYTIY